MNLGSDVERQATRVATNPPKIADGLKASSFEEQESLKITMSTSLGPEPTRRLS